MVVGVSVVVAMTTRRWWEGTKQKEKGTGKGGWTGRTDVVSSNSVAGRV